MPGLFFNSAIKPGLEDNSFNCLVESIPRSPLNYELQSNTYVAQFHWVLARIRTIHPVFGQKSSCFSQPAQILVGILSLRENLWLVKKETTIISVCSSRKSSSNYSRKIWNMALTDFQTRKYIRKECIGQILPWNWSALLDAISFLQLLEYLWNISFWPKAAFINIRSWFCTRSWKILRKNEKIHTSLRLAFVV